MKSITIPICLACDRNYIQPLTTTMASILKNKIQNEAIRFYILENTFFDSDREIINQLKSISDFEVVYKNVKNQALSLFPLKKNDKVTIEAYFRLLIPDLIPEEDRIIYLDCDIIVQDSLSEFFQIKMEKDIYICGVRDIDSRREILRLQLKRYINSGVLLINSCAMRQANMLPKFVEFVATNKDRIKMHDQDVINVVLQKHIQCIPEVWNTQVARLPPSFKRKFSRIHQAKILHYVGHNKPWMANKRAELRENYFYYQQLTYFDKTKNKYNINRFLWHLKKIPSNLWKFIYRTTNSRQGTYKYIRILGFINLKRKRKSPLLNLNEKW